MYRIKVSNEVHSPPALFKHMKQLKAVWALLFKSKIQHTGKTPEKNKYGKFFQMNTVGSSAVCVARNHFDWDSFDPKEKIFIILIPADGRISGTKKCNKTGEKKKHLYNVIYTHIYIYIYIFFKLYAFGMLMRV